MNNVSLIIVILLLLISTSAHSAALGLPPDAKDEPHEEQEAPYSNPVPSGGTAMLGYSIGFASIAVDDPEGDTNTTSTLQPITLIYTDQRWNSVRYWSEFYYYKGTLDAKLNKVGQDVQRYGFRLSLQRRIFNAPHWSAWVGGGMDISQAVYSARHTVDSEGFLLDVLPKRDEMTTAGILNVFAEWSMNPVWTFGAKIEQSFPGSGHIKESLAAVTVLYRY